MRSITRKVVLQKVLNLVGSDQLLILHQPLQKKGSED
jgi:hypothetical protein